MKFEILNKGQLVEVKELGEGSYKIGRAAECDIQLKSAQVSKQHAMLVIKGDRAAIIDTGSSNGVFVNAILVKKQRIELGDEVGVGEFKIRIARPKAGGVGVRRGGGNAAEQLELGEQPAEAPQQQTPQERLAAVMDQKVLFPFYGMLKAFDYRWILGTILMGSLVFSVLLSVLPFIRWGNNITTQEALARAHTILGQVVRENFRLLAKTNDYTKLTVEAAETEKGVLAIFIIDPKTNVILAPAKYFNKSVTEVYSLLAIKKITDEKEEKVSVEKSGGEYIVAQPLYLFNPDLNDKVLSAIVIAYFQVAQGVTSTFEPTVEAALFSILLSLAAFFFISKMFTYPITQMQEQLDAALKGEDVNVSAEAKLPELETLAAVINFSISRIKQGGGGLSAPVSVSDSEGEEKAYEDAVAGFDQGSTDALLLLRSDNKVRFVGKALEEMIGMRNQYAIGQNISDACRDQSFAGTALDLADRVRQSLGQVQTAQLDINGISRSIVAIPHRNSGGEIAWVLIVVKLGGS